MEKCLVQGLGKSGMSALKALKKLGIYARGTDKRPREELTGENTGISWLDEYYIENNKALEKLEEFDTLIKSPGISFENNIVKKAIEKGIRVIDEIEFAYSFFGSGVKIIAVTGTNGKTTTTSLIGHIFKASEYRCYVAGNIGEPLSSLIGRVRDGDIIVVEVSSFQLEGIMTFKPDVAVLLNLAPDHLDRHKNFLEYVKAKARIFENQSKEDIAVLNLDDENCLNLLSNYEGYRLYFSTTEKVENGAYQKKDNLVMKRWGEDIEVIKKEDIKIPGEHNIANILASMCVASTFEFPPRIIEERVKSFKGVEHRLEMLGDIKGVRFYNDSKATNVKASEIALEAVISTSYKEPLIIILGGMDKGEDFDNLALKIKKINAQAIIYGETASKLEETLKKYSFKNLKKVISLEEAVYEAFNLAKESGTVLFSPACASWDMFNNFEERGKLFKEEVFKRGKM